MSKLEELADKWYPFLNSDFGQSDFLADLKALVDGEVEKISSKLWEVHKTVLSKLENKEVRIKELEGEIKGNLFYKKGWVYAYDGGQWLAKDVPQITKILTK